MIAVLRAIDELEADLDRAVELRRRGNREGNRHECHPDKARAGADLDPRKHHDNEHQNHQDIDKDRYVSFVTSHQYAFALI